MSHVEWHPVYSYWDIDETKPYRQVYTHTPGEVTDTVWEQGEVVADKEDEPEERGFYEDVDLDIWLKYADDVWILTTDINVFDLAESGTDSYSWKNAFEYGPFQKINHGWEEDAGE
jgi:hypothetical protein